MSQTSLPEKIGRPATMALAGIGVTSLEQVAKMTEHELDHLHGVGPKAIGILKEALAENNMSLAG